MQSATPSGLFPSASQRPRFREPHPVRAPGVLIGAATAFAWQLMVGLFATSVRGLIGLLSVAVLVAAAVAVLLLRLGDRGVAVGVAGSATLGGCVVGMVAAVRWLTLGWPL